jgi:DNA-directed RNA polymerase subunit RPC12/RpoP
LKQNPQQSGKMLFHSTFVQKGHGKNMTISEKVAYIMGLTDGMKIDAESNEGKLTLAILDVLKDIALELEAVDETLDEVAEVVADIEDVVDDLEEEVFGDCDDYDFDDDDLYEITCSKCDNTVGVDMSMLENDAVNCPNCGEKIEFDIDFINGDCDCPDCEG